MALDGVARRFALQGEGADHVGFFHPAGMAGVSHTDDAPARAQFLVSGPQGRGGRFRFGDNSGIAAWQVAEVEDGRTEAAAMGGW